MSAKRAVATRVSMRVSPVRRSCPCGMRWVISAGGLLYLKSLGDLVDGGDDGKRNEPDEETHEKQEKRLNDGREVPDRFVDLTFIEFGDVGQILLQIPRCLANLDHSHHHRREKRRPAFQIARHGLAALYALNKRFYLATIVQVMERPLRNVQRVNDGHAAFEKYPQRTGKVRERDALRYLGEYWNGKRQLVKHKMHSGNEKNEAHADHDEEHHNTENNAVFLQKLEYKDESARCRRQFNIERSEDREDLREDEECQESRYRDGSEEDDRRIDHCRLHPGSDLFLFLKLVGKIEKGL